MRKLHQDLEPANILGPMVDEPLSGGGVTAVSRVEGTIRRSTGWWSDAVHALLECLKASGFEASPRFLGTDERGREIPLRATWRGVPGA